MAKVNTCHGPNFLVVGFRSIAAALQLLLSIDNYKKSLFQPVEKNGELDCKHSVFTQRWADVEVRGRATGRPAGLRLAAAARPRPAQILTSSSHAPSSPASVCSPAPPGRTLHSGNNTFTTTSLQPRVRSCVRKVLCPQDEECSPHTRCCFDLSIVALAKESDLEKVCCDEDNGVIVPRGNLTQKQLQQVPSSPGLLNTLHKVL